MLKGLTPVIGAVLFAASTALCAQPTTPAPTPGAGKGDHKGHERRFDCSQAKDPKACEERREKMRSAMKKAHEACQAKKGDERRQCMGQQMCAQAKDPAKCEARLKEHAEKRKQHREERREKQGDKK